MKEPAALIHRARTGMWHLRTGGVSQFREWQKRRRIAALNPAAPTPEQTGRSLKDTFPPINPPADREPVFGSLRVGVILDDFSALAFQYEWDTVALSRTRWEEQIIDLDFVFVESAWNGNSGAWKYQLTGDRGVKEDVRQLLATCRERNIPTVFWNKEDPPHFDDFLELASLCDWVFTSDSRLVPEYRKQLGHDQVGSLSFGAQPAVHNPARPSGPRSETGVAFAGMYFAHKYPERREQMDWLLGGAADAASRTGDRFVIFSRQHGGDDRYQFPGVLASRVIGSLPYPNMLTAYKDFAAFLNVNSVVDSPSMCARRIFEISATGTPVVSAPSAALDHFFPPDEVFQPATREEATHIVRALMRSSELRDRTVHRAQRRIWSEHTYTHRAMQVMNALGLSYEDPTLKTCTVICSTNRPGQIDHILHAVSSQRHLDVQLSLITHGYDIDASELAARADELGLTLTHQAAPSSVTLGECLNLAVERADGDLIAKFDDDDLYGENYLRDQTAALRYSDADLVGKQAHYMHLEASNTTLLRFPEREHKHTDFVMGPTMVGRAEIFRSFPFAARTRGEDTAFQRNLTEHGASIYSSDRFNFVQMRSGTGAHTWAVAETELLATGVVHGYGLAPEHHFF